MKYKAILVDDDPYAIERLAYLLREYEEIEVVARETTVSKAMMRIRALHPDILFLDVEMPGMTGIELVDELQKEVIFIPVIYITAYEHYAIKALRQEAVDYLLKPVDAMELKEAMERLKRCSPYPHSSGQQLISGFTQREKQILTLLKKGFSSKQIAVELSLSPNTIDTYRRKMLKKAGVKNTTELVGRLGG